MELLFIIPLWLMAGGVWCIVGMLYDITKYLSEIDDKMSKDYKSQVRRQA